MHEKKNEMVESIVYVSCAQPPLTPDKLVALLTHARSRNAADGLCGVLLYWDGDIMQALQGPKLAVDRCFDRICADARHSDLMVLLREAVDAPDFTGWPMGFGPTLSRAERDGLPGAAPGDLPATRPPTSTPGIPSGAGTAARVLLESFHHPRWQGH